MKEFERGPGKNDAPNVEEDQINPLIYARVTWRYRWLIFGLCTAAVTATFLYTIRQPKIFEAQATFIAPRG